MVVASGEFEVRVRWRRPERSPGAMRAAAFALLGQAAESATLVRERPGTGVLEAVAGILAGDGPFAGHGHVIVLRVVD